LHETAERGGRKSAWIDGVGDEVSVSELVGAW
jgi:hypothetical protein